MNFRYKAGIGLALYVIIPLPSGGLLDHYTHNWIPLYSYPIHIAIVFLGMTLLSMTLFGTYKLDINSLPVVITGFVIVEFISMTNGQMVKLDGTLITEAVLWNHGIDALFGWIFIQLGFVNSTVYYLTYIITPIILVSIMCLLLTTTELKKVVKKVL